LERIHREGNRLVATFLDEYGAKRIEKTADQVIVEHGSKPADELYFELKPGSRNFGEVDYPALIAQRPQSIETNPQGAYQLYRIGDAVSSRNIHAAIYDALRLIRTM
jgi:N-methyl-L-proline demethylase